MSYYNFASHKIINDHEKLNAEVAGYQNIPKVSDVTEHQVLDNYYQVKMGSNS